MVVKVKKIIIYVLCLMTVCFILPAIFTNTSQLTASSQNIPEKNEAVQETKQPKEQDTVQESTKEATEGKYSKIKLLHLETGEVEEVLLEEYLCHVVSAEMPATFEKEALKAQAMVARTYTIYKVNHKKHDNADICDSSSCCQAWISKEDRFARWEESKREENWKKIEEAVNETKGKVVAYNKQAINAFFHSNSGGTTEIPVNVWGGSQYPYLQVVETAGEEGYTQYASEATFSNEEIMNKLKEKYSDIQIDFTNPEEIKILEHTESGRVKTIKFGNHNLSGVETRSIFGLKSANFEVIRQENQIQFQVKGYGHGVGMSQTGADSLAKQGKTAEEIIHHFYANVEILDSNEV